MDDSWCLDQAKETKQNTPVRGTRGKQESREEQKEESSWFADDAKGNNEVQSPKKAQKKNRALDESDWLDVANDEKQQKNTRGSSKRDQNSPPDTSFLNGVQQPFKTELEREDPNTSWVVDESKNKQNQTSERETTRRGNRNRNEQQTEPKRRGNRQVNEQPKGEEQAPRRGNRYRNAQNEGGDFKKKKSQTQFYQPNNNNYDRNERGGFRGSRGRGGGRGSYNNFHNNYYNHRNNNSSNDANNYNDSNYNRVNYRPKYDTQSQGRNNNNTSNNSSDREYRGNRYQKRNEDNSSWEYQNNNNYNNNYNRNYNRNNQHEQKVPQNQPEVQKEVQKTKKINVGQTALMTPKGRKCWPECSINILGCKLVVTSRHLLDFRCKLLIVPYSTIQMQYYPGNAVNSSSVDYRKKILNKGSILEPPGTLYLQKAIQVYSFEGLGFLKINKQNVEESLKLGIKQLLRVAELYEKPITFESIVFAICQELGDPKWVLNPFFQHLQSCRRVKEVWITTMQGECYVKAAGSFTKQVQKLFKSNEIFLN